MKKLIFIIGIFLLPGTVNASTTTDIDRFSINIGSFITENGLKFRLDSMTSGTGTPIDFENDLGLDSNETVIRIDGQYWITLNHRIDFSFFDLSREATRTIINAIQYGDETFSSDTTVNTNFKNSIYKLAYSYFFYNRNKINLAGLFGIYVLDINASISVPSTSQTEAAKVTAPLPVIGLRAEYALSADTRLKASYEYFAINPDDDLDGRLTDLYFAVEHQLTEHTGIGIAYDRFTFDVNVVDGSLRFDTDWGYTGTLLYFNLHY